MKNKLRSLLSRLLPVAVLLGLWQLCACLLRLPFVIPTVPATLRALLTLVCETRFWLTVLASLGRVLLGFLLGSVLGILLAALAHALPPLRPTLGLLMSIIRSTPVASFILLLWVLIGGDSVPVAIALLMVSPILYQNLTDAFAAVDPALSEVCTVFEITGRRRLRLLLLPPLLHFTVPGLISGIGLAWKAGIAAEIIAYTARSIGKEIYLAKSSFEGAEMFAWTLTVILISLLLEQLLTRLLRRFQRYES